MEKLKKKYFLWEKKNEKIKIISYAIIKQIKIKNIWQ